MGNVQTSNEADQIVEALMSVVNTTSQECRSGLIQEQIINLNPSGAGSVVDIDSIIGTQAAAVDTQCFQSSVNSSSLENDMEQVINQQMDVINQTFSLTSTASSNINRAIVNLKNEVLNDTRQTCSNLARQSSVFSAAPTAGGVVRLGTLDWNQTFEGITTCVQDSTNVVRAKNTLQQLLDQENKVEVKSNLTTIFLIIGIAIAVIIIAIVIGLIFIAPQVASTASSVAKVASPVPF